MSSRSLCKKMPQIFIKKMKLHLQFVHVAVGFVYYLLSVRHSVFAHPSTPFKVKGRLENVGNPCNGRIIQSSVSFLFPLLPRHRMFGAFTTEFSGQ